jgi:hypothetical protein
MSAAEIAAAEAALADLQKPGGTAPYTKHMK